MKHWVHDSPPVLIHSLLGFWILDYYLRHCLSLKMHGMMRLLQVSRNSQFVKEKCKLGWSKIHLNWGGKGRAAGQIYHEKAKRVKMLIWVSSYSFSKAEIEFIVFSLKAVLNWQCSLIQFLGWETGSITDHKISIPIFLNKYSLKRDLPAHSVIRTEPNLHIIFN